MTPDPNVGAPPARDAGRVVALNTGAMVAARYVAAGLGWAGTVLIVRALSPEEWGQFSFVFAMLGVLSIITDLGVGRVALKGLVDPDLDRASFAGTYVVLRIVLGVLGYALAVGFVVAANYPAEVVRATAVAGIVVALATPSNAIDSIFQANLQLHRIAAASIGGRLLQLAIISALAVSGGTLLWFCVPPIAAELTILAWKIQGVRRIQRLRLCIHWTTWKVLLRDATPLAVGMVLWNIYFRVDAVILSKIDTFEAVGVYSVAYKFVELVHQFPQALMAVLLTIMVRAWPKELSAFGDAFRRGLMALAISIGLVAIEFAVFAHPIIVTLYGDRYGAGATAARLVVMAECIAAMSALCFTTLIAVGRPGAFARTMLAGLVLNVGLNLWLIPAHSYTGAAWATVVTEVVVLLLLAKQTLRLPVLHPLPLPRLAGIAASAAAATGFALLARIALPWPMAAVAAAAAYLALVHCTRAAGPEGLRSLLRETPR